MLLLTACSRFFVMGITIVGLPYIVRTVLGFHAQYYGAAESALAVATILGSVAAGLLTTKLRIHRLSILLASIGIFMIPAGIAFLSVSVKYLDQRTKATQISQFDLVLEKTGGNWKVVG